jgi:TolA-binding protein
MFRTAYFLALVLSSSAPLAAAQEPPAPPEEPKPAAEESTPTVPGPTPTAEEALTPAPAPQAATVAASAEAPLAVSPAFTTVPELRAGFDLLYQQKFTEARKAFSNWEARNPTQPFGAVAVSASYLFEELYRQGVLSSDFFLNEKRFLHGIDGKPDPDRMTHFREALAQARQLAGQRKQTNPLDGEALFALTLAAGMESDAESILMKRHLDGLKRMKEANEYAKQLLAQHPEAADAYIAPGIANYVIGSLNPGFRFALWFGGIHGDKKLGMQQTANAAENGRYLKPFAKIMLALAARREKQNALAQKLLRELTEQYPQNDLFASEYAKAMSRPVPAAILAR